MLKITRIFIIYIFFKRRIFIKFSETMPAIQKFYNAKNLKQIMKKRGKKAQLHLSFQFILSLIIMAVALFVGFFVINMFLDRAEQTKFGLFATDLKNQVIEVWQTEEASKTITLDINKNIDYVCFANLSQRCSASLSSLEGFCRQASLYTGNNLFFYPFGIAEKYDSQSYWKIQCGTKEMPKECVSLEENPTCIKAENGKVRMTLTNAGNRLVVIS